MEIMKKYISEIIAFAIGVLITSMAFLLFQNRQLEKQIIEVEKPIVRTDTIKADTAVNYVQREYYTNINTDTITGQIKAVVSGFNPSLDTLQYNLHIPTRTITNTIETQTTKYKQKHWNFTVGVGAGYGLINRKADVFVGGIIGYSF